ncbi:MAG: DsrE family protein [Betaproteobacteria bacterium]|nr:DsrE family protein [Betaproteobacteria bacterium]
MNCQDLQRLVHAYLDYELDLMTSLDLEAHLNECSACRARHAEMRALRDLEARQLRFHAAPAPLKARIARNMRAACGNDDARRWRAWRAATAVSVLALAALLAWVVLPRTLPGPHQVVAQSQEKMVYHIANSEDVATALRNVANLLEISPDARIVVVANNQGVDFLLRGARDRDGTPYEPAVSRLKVRGVDFRVCNNTLARRRIDSSQVIPEAKLVPSGIAEISRLQTREGYAYMKL